MKNIVSTLTLALTIFANSFASDWPQFKRTANRLGCDLSEQVALPSRLCNWFDFGSPIRASATVVNGKAYCISSRGLLARMDLAGNSVDWHVNLGGVNNESTPSVANGKVYVGSTTGNFYVLDAETGAILKIYAAKAAILAPPLLFKNSVYFGGMDGVFHALDSDGNPKWTFQADSAILYGAAADSDWIVFPSGLNCAYWLCDRGTRADMAYFYRCPAWGTATACSDPVIWDNHVYMGFSGQEVAGYLYRFALAGSGSDSVLVESTVRTSLSIDTATRKLFFGSSYDGLKAFGGYATWRTTNPNWATAPAGAYGVNSSPAVIKNCVIFGEETGKIHFCAKDSIGLGTYKTNLGGAHAFWSYALPSGKAFEASPAVSDGRVVVGSLDGCLYGFGDGTEVTGAVKVDGNGTGIAKRTVSLPGTWTLTVFPNPASAGRVSLELSGLREKAAIAIYGIGGNLINTLETKTNGVMQWDLKNTQGRAVSSGTYYAVVKNAAGRQIKTFNLQVIK